MISDECPSRKLTGCAYKRADQVHASLISWSWQFEYLERAKAKLKIGVPFTLLIIFALLYLIFRQFDEALLVLATLPFALIGGFWFIYQPPALTQPGIVGRRDSRARCAGRAPESDDGERNFSRACFRSCGVTAPDLKSCRGSERR